MKRIRQWLVLALIVLLAGAVFAGGERQPAPVSMIVIQGAIDVPMSSYLSRAIAEATRNRSQALLVLLDTPGGGVSPMTDMTKAILNAPLPVIVYVYPAGGYAMSAGTFITMSAHIAAMQPATSIGAAHPISLLGGEPETPAPEPEQPAPSAKEKGKKPAAPAAPTLPRGSKTEQKLENAFAEQAKVIAEARGRNTDWAADAVRNSVTATAREAVKLKVVDLLADDVNDLLQKVDGKRITLSDGRVVILHTASARIVEIEASMQERFLHVLADPNMLLILLVLAGLGIMFELQNPGAILPGVVGGISLLLALYSMSVLPPNFTGVALIIFGMLLLLAEIKVTSYGILTVGGVISFIMGAFMLTNTAVSPLLQVSWQVVIVMTALVIGFFVFIVQASVRAHLRKVRTGVEGMIRQHGYALTRLAPAGEVMVEGERWKAKAVEGEIEVGEEIEVVGEEGLTLFVRKRVLKERTASQ